LDAFVPRIATKCPVIAIAVEHGMIGVIDFNLGICWEWYVIDNELSVTPINGYSMNTGVESLLHPCRELHESPLTPVTCAYDLRSVAQERSSGTLFDGPMGRCPTL
jgi:hypothetical protein